MGKIRFVVVSDMHAGAELSLATAVDETGARTDPTIPSITAAAFGRAVQSVLMQQNTALAAMDDPATIILLGDIMDLAFSDRNAAAQSYVGWLKGLVGAQAGLFAPDMIFLPGNHDHSLWTSARMAAETASVAAGGAPQMALYTRSETGNALPSGFVTALNQRAGIYGDVRIHYPNFALHDPTLGRCVAFHHGHFLDSAYRMMSAAHDMLTGVPRLHVTVAELADENANWIDFGWSSFGQSSTLSRDVATLYTGLSVASEAHHLRQRIARAISAELGPKLPMGGQEGVKAALRYTVLAALDASFGAYTDTARASISDALSDSGVDGVQAYIDGPLAGQLRDELGHIPPQLSFVFGHTHKPFIDTLVPAKGPVVQLCNTGGWYLDSPRLNGREGVALVLVDDMLNVVSVRCFATPQNGAVAPTEVRLASHPTPDGEAFAAEVAGYVAAAGPVWAHLAQVAATEYALRQEMLLARLNRSDHEAIIAGGMPMTRIQLSKPLSDAKARYEVVVIGSGYGASIAASRLARAGREVAVLERGREMRPGDFPRSMTEIAGDAQVQVAETGKRLGRADGLLDFHLNDDLSVLIGCGLGGTSLINANVALESDPRLIDHFNWPAVYRDNPGLLAPYYERARKALGSRPYPETAPALPKLAALQQSATEMGKPFYRPPINVTFEDGPNAFGFAQNACNLCGDCCTGCNYGAKNTTLMNYLPDARAHGAQIFTGAEVRHLEKTATGWDVHIRPIEGGAVRVISADLVVMGAGTLGSTEILLRSKTKGLALSKQLGQRFSGNGDVLAFGYNANLDGDMDGETPRPMLRGIGAGSNAPDLPEYQPGPCIAGIIDCRDPAAPVTDGMVIEEGVMPGGLAMGFSAIFFLNQAITGDPFKFGDTSLRLQDAADVGNAINTDPASLSRFAYDGPVGRTQTYLVMSHDASDGEVTLTNDQAVVRWQGAGSEPSILRNNKILAQASDAIWAEFQPNPMWQTEMGRKLVTVHPIGGCVMADSADTGVVNGDCQVFDGAGGVHAGLYVCDGAVIPGALGVNPLLTISAVAEYAVEQMATSRGWTIEYTGTRPLPAECHVPDPIKPPPPPDIAAQLQSIIDAMKASKTLIDNGDYAAARAIFEAAYKAVTEGVDSPLAPSWAVLRLMLTDTLMRAIAEVFAEFLPILEAVDAKIDSGDFLGALTVIEDAAGDFTPGLRFDEKMEGVIAPADRQMDRPISDAYRVAQRRGEMTGPEAAIVGHFTISTESIERLLTDPDHRATLTGTIDCPALGGRLILDEGAVFDLLRANDGEIECWNMIYSGKMQDSDDETPFYFKGVKTLKRRAGSSWWTDLTTLNVDIWDGTAPHGLPRFQGIMTLGLEDLAQQLSTVQTPMAQNIWTSGFDILATLVAAQWQGNLAQRLQDQDLRAEIIRQGLRSRRAWGIRGCWKLCSKTR
ncbi:GMC oxidoreductase [Pseudorhodobacter ferrugineus]|uniref:GMC oxidoreductase n=1 Tax=Pseudorhodobacter ferrugineus TaxID=77008 RepID=UPI00067C76F5|nr:GMC family oxidoreductase [Pseudorhodobacter ferrugineus]